MEKRAEKEEDYRDGIGEEKRERSEVKGREGRRTQRGEDRSKEKGRRDKIMEERRRKKTERRDGRRKKRREK